MESIRTDIEGNSISTTVEQGNDNNSYVIEKKGASSIEN